MYFSVALNQIFFFLPPIFSQFQPLISFGIQQQAKTPENNSNNKHEKREENNAANKANEVSCL